MAGDLVRVFVLPPSGETLEARLRRRAQDPDQVVAKRMAAASSEISHWAEYDYVIVNADLAESVAGLKAILAAERLRRDRMTGLSSFVRDLQAALT
jgi:guanylate kinase